MSTPSDIKIGFYKISNRLKDRMGQAFLKQKEGFLAPSAIEEADKMIAEMCATCPATIEGHLASLTALWEKMKSSNEADRHEVSEKVFAVAHEIKDIGSMCGYQLIAHFAESLRDYIEKTNLNHQAQIVIVQAHLDAMNIVHRSGFKKDGGPEAEELKQMVRKAIEKYS